MGGDAREPRFPPAPGEGVSDYRAPQPRAAGSEVIAPPGGGRKTPHLLVAPADDPLSPEAIAAYRARREAHHRRIARRSAFLVAVLAIGNTAFFIGVGFFVRDRINAQLLMTLVVVVELIVIYRVLRHWAAQDGRN
jgi:hypothetical protein